MWRNFTAHSCDLDLGTQSIAISILEYQKAVKELIGPKTNTTTHSRLRESAVLLSPKSASVAEKS